MAGISVGLLLLSGALEGWFGWQEARTQVARQQGLQAQAAAAEIEQFLHQLQQGLTQVQALPWGQAGFGARERREELQRLLALNPALVELVDLDAAGREVGAVSRLAPDRTEPGRTAPAGVALEPGLAAATLDADGVPRVWLVSPRTVPAVRGSTESAATAAGFTLALVNLRFLGDVVSGLRVADGGEVFVVDGANRLIAHADPTQVLRPRLAPPPDGLIARTRLALAGGLPGLSAVDGPGLNGAAAITTSLGLKGTNWLLFVEHPRSQALQPVVATLQRTGLLLAVAGLVAMVASAAFAARVAAPIARLRAATAGMAEGRLQQRLSLATGDEIQGLAEDFNTLSDRLQQSYAELEQKVADRTTELALRRDEAERANAAKTRFIATASHDLRQPMHAIGLLVSVLRERLRQPENRALADKTYAAVQVMEQLFGGLLDISKLDAGAVSVSPRRFALQELLDRMTSTYGPLAAAKNLRLRVRGQAAWLYTDPLLLERVLGNLVANAIRYTSRGGVLVGCRRRGGAVFLQVYDSGSGIPPTQLERIFDEFVRLGDTQADQGLGLGLAIVRRTAALLGAQVNVRSRPGRGSVFELALPLAPALPALPTTAQPPPAAQPSVAGAFVLVVDDDERNREATAAQLLQWGCLVACAAATDAALEEAERHLRCPDALVTDLHLGAGPDGRALIRRLRAQSGAWVPALLLTAELQVDAALDGDIRVLAKPCSAQTLREALAQALAGSGA